MTNRTTRAVLFAAAASLPLAAPALAQTAAQPADSHGTAADTFHAAGDPEIVITAPLRNARIDSISGVAVLTAEDLTAAARPSIGETLGKTPGVSATSFGPTASRPVLRGQQGERVRVLTNGIGAIDVSNTSADHAPAVNPLLAERIEVLRGPQSLLYGSSAIGGVVNVIDGRIPNQLPDEPLHVMALGAWGSAANERNVALSADAPIGSRWVIHADASYARSDDLRVGGYTLTPALRAQALATSQLPPDPNSDVDFAANAGLRGVLPNSASRVWSLAGGIAFIDEGGSIGLAYSRLDNRYGLPMRLATLPGQEQEAATVQLNQDRIDGRATVATGGSLIDEVSLRLGFADYVHSEIEPDGTVGTTFMNKGIEGRLELRQARRGAWSGVTGAQFVTRDFNVIGSEAFLPRNSSDQIGLFTVQQLDIDRLRLEAGARWEHSVLTAKPDPAQTQFYSGTRRFDAWSGSIGAAYELAPQWRLGANVSHTQRAPAAEELFANGPHAGTSAFEVGNTQLRKEKAWSAEAILRGRSGDFSLELSAYHSWFNGYIYEAETGAVVDGLPEFVISQADARLYGFEAEIGLTLARIGSWTLGAHALADYVHATITGQGPAPRIPPLRMLGALTLESGKLSLRAEVERVTAQDRIAAFETRTPGYTMANAEIGVRPWGADRPLTILLSANNIFDVNARRHASFIKDYAPLAGRDIRITARLDL